MPHCGKQVTPYGVSYDGQTLTEGRKLQARKNIDAATKAITVPYDDIAAANAAVTAYKDDPRRTLVLVNYKSILAPAFVGITDKPFISSFISEAEQIRKLLFQNGAWTESLQAKVNGNVRSVAQTLSDAEKAQARTNIGAQAELVSGTHIKTVNGKSLVGSGNVTVSGDGGGVVLLDFTEGDTISLTEEQIADISDDSVTVIAVRDGGRHICTGRSESGAYLYFLDYMVMVKTDTMTASIENVLHDSIGQSQSSLCHVPGESLSIDNNYRSEILCTGNTVKIPCRWDFASSASMSPEVRCCRHRTGSAMFSQVWTRRQT